MKNVLVLRVLILCSIFLFNFDAISQEICDNGIDDDGNGLVDLNDPGCTLNCVGWGGGSSTSVPSFIPNSSFEDNSCCPSSWSQLNCADTWVQATSATSDYFNTCGWMPPIVPQPLPNGNGIVAAIFSSGWQEYVGACLLHPMVAGTQYEIQFSISCESVTGTLGACGNVNTFDPIDITIFGNPSCGNLPVSTTGCPTTNGWVALGTANYTPDNTWGTLTITINPTVDMNAIMIGSPCTLPANGYNSSCYAYFMFDNLLLNASSTFSNAGVTVDGAGTWQSNSTTVTASPDSIAGTYQWYLDGVALINATGTSLSLPSSCTNNFGNGVLTFVQVIDTGCVSVDYNITAPVFPTADFTVNDGCMGVDVVFNDLSTANGNTLIDWQWDFDDGVTSNTQAVSHTFTSDGTYNVQLIVADSICADTVVVPVVIYPIPDAQFTNLNGCLGFDIDFQDNSTVNPPDNITGWEWDFGNGSTSTLQNPTALYGNTGAFPVQLIVTSNNGCVDTIQQPVNLFDNPTADFTMGSECLYNAITFTEQSTVASGSIVNYEWDFGDNNTSLVQNPSNLYGTQSTYDVELVVTSDNGCTDTIVYQYTPLEVPVASFSSTSDCVYDSLVFADNSTLVAPGSFLWSFGDGTPIISNQNPSHLYGAVGQYNTTLIVTSANGCVDDTTIAYSAYPVPNIGFTSDVVCENVPPTSFNNTSNVSSGSIATWSWDFGDGGLSNLESPVHVYSSSGVYPVTLIAISDNGCSDTLTQDASVLVKPTAAFSADVLEGCSPVCVNFTDASVANSGNITSWRWDFGTGPTSTVQNPNECFVNSSNTTDAVFDIQLIATNDLGCADTLLLEDYITSWPVPFADFAPTPEAMDMHHTEEIVFANNTVGGSTYEWEFDNGTSSSSFEPTTFYTDTGVYVVTMITTTPNGCVDSTFETVRIYAVVTLFAPNTFTPNGDGINDDFMFKSYGIVEKNLEFMIFDRWGEMIYKAESFKAWDGYVKGRLAQEDTYVYKIECQDVFGEKHTYRGHVNLLR